MDINAYTDNWRDDAAENLAAMEKAELTASRYGQQQARQSAKDESNYFKQFEKLKKRESDLFDKLGVTNHSVRDYISKNFFGKVDKIIEDMSNNFNQTGKFKQTDLNELSNMLNTSKELKEAKEIVNVTREYEKKNAEFQKADQTYQDLYGNPDDDQLMQTDPNGEYTGQMAAPINRNYHLNTVQDLFQQEDKDRGYYAVKEPGKQEGGITEDSANRTLDDYWKTISQNRINDAMIRTAMDSGDTELAYRLVHGQATEEDNRRAQGLFNQKVNNVRQTYVNNWMQSPVRASNNVTHNSTTIVNQAPDANVPVTSPSQVDLTNQISKLYKTGAPQSLGLNIGRELFSENGTMQTVQFGGKEPFQVYQPNAGSDVHYMHTTGMDKTNKAQRDSLNKLLQGAKVIHKNYMLTTNSTRNGYARIEMMFSEDQLNAAGISTKDLKNWYGNNFHDLDTGYFGRDRVGGKYYSIPAYIKTTASMNALTKDIKKIPGGGKVQSPQYNSSVNRVLKK